MNPSLLETLFRYLQQFEALFESEGTDTIHGPDGPISLHDVRRLYSLRNDLPCHQASAIELLFYRDLPEEYVELTVPGNPLIYAREGVARICEMDGPQSPAPVLSFLDGDCGLLGVAVA
jgi:hypothetical protein